MRFGFFLREALRGLRRSSAPALAALLTVMLTALVLGVFIPIVQATTGSANAVRDRLVVDVYLTDSSSKSERDQALAAIEGTANVKSVDYVSKAEGLKELGRKMRGTEQKIELLGSNPLPDLYRVVPEEPDRLDALVTALRADSAGSLAAVDEVRPAKKQSDVILKATGLVKGIGIALAALLLFASIALIANTIRLSIFARRREVEVMKLVGATNWFIRWPFVIEGVVVGFLGGVLAVLLLMIAKATFVDPLSESFALIASPDTIDFPLLVVVLLLACVGVSAIGSGITLRRFLRV